MSVYVACLSITPSAARYCLSGLPVDCQMKNITNPDQTSLLLEDLIIWTNYEIEVAAYNGAGRGTYSHKVTEWTLQGGEATRSKTALNQKFFKSDIRHDMTIQLHKFTICFKVGCYSWINFHPVAFTDSTFTDSTFYKKKINTPRVFH